MRSAFDFIKLLVVLDYCGWLSKMKNRFIIDVA